MGDQGWGQGEKPDVSRPDHSEDPTVSERKE